MSAEKLIGEGRWLQGPQSLTLMEDNWPIPPVVLQGTVPDPEVMPITDVLEGDLCDSHSRVPSTQSCTAANTTNDPPQHGKLGAIHSEKVEEENIFKQVMLGGS